MPCNFSCTFVPIRVALDLQHPVGAGAVRVLGRPYVQAYMASGCNRVDTIDATESLGTHKCLKICKNMYRCIVASLY